MLTHAIEVISEIVSEFAGLCGVAAGEQGVCERAVGRPTTRACIPTQPQPGTRQHPEREAGSAQHDQLIM